MKSLTIPYLLTVLCALWLPNYVTEGTVVQIVKCTAENPIPGAVAVPELTVTDNAVTSSKMDIQQELNPGLISVHVTIYNEDDDAVFEQTIDLCSMSSNDIFKNYFKSFEQAEFNEGSCPIPPGSYTAGSFEINVEDGPEGVYKGSIDAMEGPNTISTITCEAKIE